MVGGKRDGKAASSDEPNKRIISRLKAAQTSGKLTTGDRSQPGKDIAKRQSKRSRKRRRPQDESRSTSHDKNSTIIPGKQIRITKDKHFINPNLSKLIRRSINDCSQGQEKTVKIGSRNKERQAQEEKKKLLDTFNETIRKNNLRSMQNSKEIKGDSLGASNANIGWTLGSGGSGQMSNIAKKLNKIMKCKKESDETHHGRETGQTLQAERSSPSKQSLLNFEKEADKKRKTFNSTRENVGHGSVLPSPLEMPDLKKGPQIAFKKVSSSDTPKLTTLYNPHVNGESRDRTREKSGDDRKSSEDMKRRTKLRLKKEQKKDKKPGPGENEKIKENLLKLNQKAKNAVRHQQRAVSKRMTRQRRSKSSNDLLSDQMLKKMLGRSDSVNIKHGQNEDQMYQEFRNLIAKDKKGTSQRDTTLRDKMLKKSYKEKAILPKQTSSRPIKLKQSKSTKVYKKLESFPVKVKKVGVITGSVPSNQLAPALKDTQSTEKSKEREILDRISLLSSKIQKNYETIPSFVAKMKPQPVVPQSLYMPGTTVSKKSKKQKPKGSKKKVADPDTGSEDIPAEEKELIDKEILMPKSSSDYASGFYATKKEQPTSKADQNGNSNVSNLKDGVDRLDYSPKSMRIRDSESSDREKSVDSMQDEDPGYQTDGLGAFSSKDQPQETPRNSQEDPFSKENLDKWMFLLQEFKKCQKDGNLDGELKDVLISFCDRTQKGITQLIEEVHLSKKGVGSSEQKNPASQIESPTNEDSKRRKKPHLGIDVDRINEDFEEKAEGIQIKENRSNSFQWLKAEFEQNLQELAKLLGNNKDTTIKKIQVDLRDIGSHEAQ